MSRWKSSTLMFEATSHHRPLDLKSDHDLLDTATASGAHESLALSMAYEGPC